MHKSVNYQKRNKRKLDLESKTAKLNDFFTQVPEHDVPIPGQNQSPSSEVDSNTVDYTVNTTLIISERKYDDVRIIDVSQVGLSSTCLITYLTLPVNSLDSTTANVDSSYFEIH